jgi:hypothetical protein
MYHLKKTRTYYTSQEPVFIRIYRIKSNVCEPFRMLVISQYVSVAYILPPPAVPQH